MNEHRSATKLARSDRLRLAGLALFLVMTVLAAGFLLKGNGANPLRSDIDEYVLLPGSGEEGVPDPIHTTAAPGMLASPTLGKEFAESLVLLPDAASKAGKGFWISAKSDPDMLVRHKLRTGDIILDMDGRPLDADRIGALGGELGMLDDVEITFVRDHQVRKRLLTFNK